MMNYLQKKKKAMLNYVSGITPTETLQITTKSASDSPKITVTYNGVSTDYGYGTIIYNPIIVGNIFLWYNDAKWNITLLGNSTINGTQHNVADVLEWSYTTSVDYEIVGTNDLNNSVFVKTKSTGGTNATVFVIDKDEIFSQRYTSSNKYNKSIYVNYQSAWKITANQNIKYNGVTYTNGQQITQWAYNETKCEVFGIL